MPPVRVGGRLAMRAERRTGARGGGGRGGGGGGGNLVFAVQKKTCTESVELEVLFRVHPPSPLLDET